MRDLPRSLYSTPGMVAIGEAGVMPADHPRYGGLRKTHAARSATIAKTRFPAFGQTTCTMQGVPIVVRRSGSACSSPRAGQLGLPL